MRSPVHLLLLGPDAGDARRLREMLEGTIQVGVAASLDEARGHIESADAVLLDLSGVGDEGLPTLRAVRAAAPAAAIIVLSADEEFALRAVREGAQDSLLKGRVEPESLARAVRYAVERRRIERSLRSSEEFNRRIIENMPGGLVRIDARGTIQAANEQATRFLGLHRDELSGRVVSEFAGTTVREDGSPFPPEEYPISRALATGTVAGPRTIGVRTADGRTRWGVFSAMPLRDASGEVSGGVVTFVDITGRKRDEARLHLQRTILEQVALGEPVAAILDRLCGFVEESIPRSRCAVMLNQDDGRLRTASAPSLGSAVTEALDRACAAGGAGEAACRVCEPMLTEGARHGFARCWSHPVRAGEQASVGLVVIWRTEPGEPDATDRELLETAASLAGIAVARARAEHALRESEARFRVMADSAPMLVWMTDTAGNEVYYNAAWLRYTGETLEQAVSEGWRRSVHPEDVQRCLATFERARAERAAFTLEYRLRRADRTYGWVLDQGVPRFGRDGTYTGHIGSCADITERKRAEESLRQSEATQRALLEAIPDLLFRMRRDGTYLNYIGPKGARLLARPEAFLGKRADQVLPPEHSRMLLEAISRSLDTQSMASYEYTAERDGATLHHEARIVPCGPDEVLALVRNITARRRTEAALRESEERYRSLVETSPDGIIVHQEGKIVLANQRMAQLLGLAGAGHLLGRTVLDLVHPDDRETVKRRIARIREHGEPAPPAVERLLGGSGEPVLAEIAASPCVHEGRPAVQVVVRDIRERRKLEEDLRRAQKIQAVGQLASGVAHDFNNLLTAIFGYTSLARRTLAPSHPANRSLERVEEAARQAAGVTRGLLTFSRLTPGDKHPVLLADVVREAARLLRRTLPASVQLETDLAVRPPAWVDADPTQLQQVVLNLAINARDAMPEGGRLRVALEADPAREGRRVRLVVSDTGVGMTPEVEARIFEPFFTTKAAEQGTGLGLAIVHGIVRDHGGSIAVRTAPGQGTALTVELPCVPEPLPAAGPEHQPELPRGRGESILLVEDHVYVRELIASMLAVSGYEVVQCGAGAEMMAALARDKGSVRLIVIDRSLPDGPAESWLERARAAGDTRPVVLLLGEAGPDPVLRPGGATIIVRKPFQLSDLMVAVARGLGRGPVSEGTHEPTDLRPAGGRPRAGP